VSLTHASANGDLDKSERERGICFPLTKTKASLWNFRLMALGRAAQKKSPSRSEICCSKGAEVNSYCCGLILVVVWSSFPQASQARSGQVLTGLCDLPLLRFCGDFIVAIVTILL
jgi:hypothetical protein